MVEERKDKREDDKKPKKESDLKKFLNKRSFIYLSAAVFFVVFIVPDMIAPSDLEKKLVENLDMNDEINQKIALDKIKSYRGTDGNGYSLIELIIESTKNQYTTEKIMKHSDTILEFTPRDIQESMGVGWYEVKFTFETYNELKEYIWNVNIKTDKIIPVNDGARKTMNVVDNLD